MSFKVTEIPRVEAGSWEEMEAKCQSMGYASFNNFDTLAIDVPDGKTTISCRLSNGVQITFSFLPTGKVWDQPVPGCVDIQVHNPKHGVYQTNRNGVKRPVMEFIAFGNGGSHVAHHRVDDDKPKPYFLTVLLDTPPKK